MKLEGKVALVTGGGRGIGRGIVLSLAKEGADVAVADIIVENAEKVAEEVKALGQRAIAIKVDVTQWDQVQAMVKQTIDELGKVDISVQNAGVINVKSVVELTEEDWDHIMGVNAKGVFFGCKAVLPHMLERGGGKIINVASIAGKNGFGTLSHYCASKFAVVGFTNSLAKEVATENITVNAICPGIIGTAMWVGPGSLGDVWRAEGESDKESWLRNAAEIIPQGVPQTAEDMGDLAVYLATADHVTGQAINVDGGAELH